jgi:hypothetical protein
MRLRKFNHGGVHLPTDPPKYATSESTRTQVPMDPFLQGQQEMQAFERALIGKGEEERQNKELGFDPMASGSAEMVSPMKFVSPIGDAMDMAEGLQMLYRGAKEGDLGQVAGGAGLSAAAALFAFVPGNASSFRSFIGRYPGEENRIVKEIGELIKKDVDVDAAFAHLSDNDFLNSPSQRNEATAELAEYLELVDDEFSPMEATSQEKTFLTDLMFSIEKNEPLAKTPERIKAETLIEKNKALPATIGDFKFNDMSKGNRRMIEYSDSSLGGGDYIDLSTEPISDVAEVWKHDKHAALEDPSFIEQYSDRSVSQMNMVLENKPKVPVLHQADVIDEATGAVKFKKGDPVLGEYGEELFTTGPSREHHNLITTMFDAIESGDLINPGSLSQDSYPIYLKQLEKGERYLEKGGKKQGSKLLEHPSSIDYRGLNTMGRFSNYFKIPKTDFDRVITDGMLSHRGTTMASKFDSKKEANAFLMNIKETYIDPALAKRGLPPTKVRTLKDLSFNASDEAPISLEFPLPIVEKLERGGRIGLKKKAKYGMRIKK